MLNKNDVLALHCDSLGTDMEGVCRHEGMAVFVPRMLPGEKGQVRIEKVQKRFAFGRLISLDTQSAKRQQPPCPAFDRCGGCTCQHMTYETTLEGKRQKVSDCLHRIGGVELSVPPVLGMANDGWGYRNKTALPAGGTWQAPAFGFYAPRSHRLTPIAGCPVAPEAANACLPVIRAWMTEQRVSPYDETQQAGLLRHVVLRVNRQDQVMVILVVNATALPGQQELVSALKSAVPGFISLYMSVNMANTNVILGRDNRLLWGEPVLTDELCGIQYTISPAAFFQVNRTQAERLYETALDFAALAGGETVCDVYCGAGTISLLLARHCKHVIGIEAVAPAVENAVENARRAGIDNCDFHTGLAEEILPRLVKQGLRPDVIVIDPPRKGVEPAVIEAMADAAPERIVYVSCDPATQARDVALLAQRGYQAARCQPVDMFCWTSGVENVMLLSKLSSAKHIDVHLDMDELDVTEAESKDTATYEQIKAYVLEHSGLKVSALYIAQVKRKYGIIERENYNKAKADDAKQSQCPADKEAAIVEALKAFHMIE